MPSIKEIYNRCIPELLKEGFNIEQWDEMKRSTYSEETGEMIRTYRKLLEQEKQEI